MVKSMNMRDMIMRKKKHHHHGGYDPHVWLDPKINQTFAKEIKDELREERSKT